MLRVLRTGNLAWRKSRSCLACFLDSCSAVSRSAINARCSPLAVASAVFRMLRVRGMPRVRSIIWSRVSSFTAAVKLLWLAITNIEDQRARERAKEKGLPEGSPRKAPGRLIEGQGIQGWQKVFGELALHYPDRFPTN